MKFFFAASEHKLFQDLILEMEGKNMLFSYFWLNEDKRKVDFKKLKEKGVTIFMDSGGFSARKKGVGISVYKYRDFLVRNKEYIDIAANLDVNNLEIALQNQKILEEVYPILPVYHIEEYLSKDLKIKNLIEDYCKEYKYIAIGGVAAGGYSDIELSNFFNYCFKIVLKYKTKTHGFGINSPKRILQYPFYSVDSTAWIKGGQFGIVMKWKDYKLDSTIHISDRKKYLTHSFPLNLTEDYKNRLKYNIKEILRMEKDVTYLWEKRGIKYD